MNGLSRLIIKDFMPVGARILKFNGSIEYNFTVFHPVSFPVFVLQIYFFFLYSMPGISLVFRGYRESGMCIIEQTRMAIKKGVISY